MLSSRPNPYSDANPSCERTDVELRIYSPELSPKDISEKVGITPTSSNEKGERKRSPYGITRPIPTNGWFLSSEGHVESKDVRRHLDWLLDKLVPAAAGLKELQTNPTVRMTIYCIWWQADAAGGPTLWPEQMRRMADLDLECTFELSFYGPAEDDAGK